MPILCLIFFMQSNYKSVVKRPKDTFTSLKAFYLFLMIFIIYIKFNNLFFENNLLEF